MFSVRYEDCLYVASLSNDVKKVEALLQRGEDPNKSRALHIAIFWGFIDIVRLLLRKITELCEVKEGCLLVMAIRTNDALLVEVLLSHGVNKNDGDVIQEALAINNLRIIEILLAHGFDPIRLLPGAIDLNLDNVVGILLPQITCESKQKGALLDRAVKTGNISLVRDLLQDGVRANEDDLLLSAVCRNNVEMIGFLLQVGFFSQQALLHAIALNSHQGVALFLQCNKEILHFEVLHRGILAKDVVVVMMILEHGVSYENDPLLLACHESGYEMIDVLLRRGLDPFESDVLKFAISKGLLDIVILLVENTNEFNKKKGELLKTSVYTSDLFLVQFLLDSDVDLHDGDALVAAVESKNVKMVQLLLKYGVKPGKYVLSIAIELYLMEIVFILLQNITDVINQEGEVLVKAIRTKDVFLVETLLKRGAHVHESNAMFAAIATKCKEMVMLLTLHGFVANMHHLNFANSLCKRKKTYILNK